ncbi:hypothetical protein CISG_07747 [Coccidioides immitis RMSCC 3703]|uniref:Uncharacterized protein n=2 Tax=Coccidioides immitis TaxID=5501 RepID=A0A0J8R3K6_COCIT|nr:hypothetical protein CIRG_06483 [Coccidioides immitis RMSCC 2394]KMU79316.1 hypothetical protein CISG_07747 [Coccidioides immitis RMSCC 3703]
MVQRQYWPECRRREDAPSCPYKLLRTETHIEAMESSRTHSWDAHGRRLFPHKLQPSHATTRARHVTHLKRRNAAERFGITLVETVGNGLHRQTANCQLPTMESGEPPPGYIMYTGKPD